ncbi:unnamed protein product [Lymnaea stagnalis]|uniref:BHLH domain-containing protein n=1 Tax=Lymnaea stagnalis TaxID=6523 RepID=A0AAV2IDN4_LYMST
MKKKATVKQNCGHKPQALSQSDNKRRQHVKTPDMDASTDRFTRSCTREASGKLGALPNVNVLMSSRSRQQRTHPQHADSFGEDTFTKTKNVTDEPCCDRDALSRSYEEQTSFLYGRAQASLNYRGGDKSEDDRVSVVEHGFTTETHRAAQGVVSPVSEAIHPGLGHQNEERGTLVEHGEYTNLLASAVKFEPMTPAHIQGKGQFYPEETYHGVGTRMFTGQSDLAEQWGEENARYSDIAWKHQENNFANRDYVSCVTNPAAATTNNNNNDVSFLNGNIKNSYADETADSYGSQAYFSDSSGTVVSTENGRRRRKRIQTPNQRSAANMRERRRMCHLNVAFDRLKEHLPNIKDKKKLSRIQTLKAAIYYIHLLQDSLTVS